MVVDDDSIHVIFEDLAGCLGLVGQAITGVESSQFGVFHQNGLSIVWLLGFPEDGVLLL